MIQFIRSLLGMAPDSDAAQVDVVPPPPNEIPVPDAATAMSVEHVRQQEQWLDHVAATTAAQQAIESAVHDPHRS